MFFVILLFASCFFVVSLALMLVCVVAVATRVRDGEGGGSVFLQGELRIRIAHDASVIIEVIYRGCVIPHSWCP